MTVAGAAGKVPDPVSQTVPAPAPLTPPLPGPARLASFSEIAAWNTEGESYGVDLCVGPDGRPLLAIGEEEGVTRIWDPESGQLRRTLTGHGGGVYMVRWGHLAGGRLLLAAHDVGDVGDGTVRIWDPETGETVQVWQSCEELVHPLEMGLGLTSVRISAWGYRHDGCPLLALGDSEGFVRIADPATGETRMLFSGHHGEIVTASWGRGRHGELLLATGGSYDGTVRIWDPESGEALHVLTGPGRMAWAVSWMTPPGGQPRIATVWYPEQQCVIWHQGTEGTFTGQRLLLPEHGDVYTASWVPLGDGRSLLLIGRYQALIVLDGETLAVLHTEPGDFALRGLHNITWVAAPDGRLLVAATAAPRAIRVWEIALDPPAPPPAAPPRPR